MLGFKTFRRHADTPYPLLIDRLLAAVALRQLSKRVAELCDAIEAEHVLTRAFGAAPDEPPVEFASTRFYVHYVSAYRAGRQVLNDPHLSATLSPEEFDLSFTLRKGGPYLFGHLDSVVNEDHPGPGSEIPHRARFEQGYGTQLKHLR